MKYCIQAWIACVLLVCIACAPAQQEPPQADLVLPIGQSLSANGLKAEIAAYSAGSLPQLEGSIETIELREVGGRLRQQHADGQSRQQKRAHGRGA